LIIRNPQRSLEGALSGNRLGYQRIINGVPLHDEVPKA